jgi:Sortase and related acyltransferases
MQIRQATLEDAEGVAGVLMELVAAGKRRKLATPDFALEHYLTPDTRLSVAVAIEGDTILGFQSLKLATDGNVYDVTSSWGIIGTHIRPSAARRGIGRQLFEATQQAAKTAGITDIDATIGATNDEGLGYYEAMGFRTYERLDGAVRKRFRLP